MRKIHPDLFVSSLIKYFYIFMMTLIIIICVFFSNIEYAARIKWFLAGEGGHLYLYLILGVIMLFLLQVLAGKLFIKFKDKQIIIANIVIFFIQCYVIYNWYYLLGWDVSAIRKYAMQIANGNLETGYASYYFSIYPNNQFLLCVYSQVYKVCELLNIDYLVGHFALIINQVFLYNLTSFMLYKIIQKITDKDIYPITGWLLYLIFVGVSPWLSIPYSDGGGLFFPIATLFIFYFLKDDTRLCFFLKYFLLGLNVYIGYKVKPQTTIIMIAIIIVCVFRHKHITLKAIGKLFEKFVFILIGVAIPLSIFTYQVDNLPFEINEDMNFGIAHYLMMGLNWDNNGVYNYNDVYISECETTRENRTKKNLEVTIERLEDYGLSGMAKLWHKKLLTNYNDGTFAWSTEGVDIEERLSTENKPLSFLIWFYDLTDYEGIPYYLFVSKGQLLWYGILFLSIFAFRKNKADNEIISVIKLGIIGLTLFEMIFEARARYFFTYSPFYVILAIYGMYCIEKKLIRK